MGQEVGFLLECASGNKGAGSASLVRLTSRQVFRKGLRMCCGIWAVGALTVFIPVVHFVSVPLLFILGPVAGKLFADFFRRQAEYENVQASCPDCCAPLQFTAVIGIEPPQLIKCAGCGRSVVILLDRATVPA